MAKEVTARGATVEEAVQAALVELGLSQDECAVEVLEAPRKSLFGKMKEAVVRVAPKGDDAPADAEEAVAGRSASEINAQKIKLAKEYLMDICTAMGLSEVTIQIEEKEDGARITFEGDNVAVLIGHHGETLDAMQYLAALTCNRLGGDYYRITLDCGNYRAKREDTLKGLAARIAEKVKRTGRSQLLEPMNPYERRIIHSVVTDIDGVTSKSKGEEPNRRVVILSENPQRPPFKKDGQRRDEYRSRPQKRELTMEEILKSDFKEKEEKAELYSKIDL